MSEVRWDNTGGSPENRNEPFKSTGEHRGGNHRERGFRDDPLRGLFWGLLLILVGVLFFVNQQGYVEWDTLWKYLLIGLGAIFIIDGLTRSFHPSYPSTGLSKYIPGIILILVGIAFLFNFSQWWPLILIAVGVLLLISILARRR